jgi:hypothetical protein
MQYVNNVWLDRASEARAARDIGWRDALSSVFGDAPRRARRAR